MTKITDMNKQIFIPFARTIFYLAKPYPGAVEFVNILSREHRVNIVTTQARGCEKYTLDWLHKNKIKYDSIHFTSDKSEVDGDFILDDFPDNLAKIDKSGKHTITVCMDRSYNKDWKGPRVNTYTQFLNLIDKMNNHNTER